MNAPFLSIITINYNQADGLRKTIVSVLSQTYQDFEYIVIDGNSTDQSVAVIKEVDDKMGYWVSEPDTGIYNAMNKGIMVAQGQYLLFLNSGDTFTDSNALSNFINHSRFHGDIIYGDYKFENGEKIYPESLTPIYFMRSSLPHQSTLFKREVFQKMGLYDESFKIIADRAFYLKCFLSCEFTFTHIKYPLAQFDLKGISHNLAHKELKKVEDEVMFRRYYGLYYKDLRRHLELEKELSALQKKTLFGIWKRLVLKLKKIWKHQRW